MLVVGLTGSIGMGKSAAAARFGERGIAVFDADAEVHALYSGPLAQDIEKAFPGTTSNGSVDRAKLSKALLADPQRFKQLEAIVHPAVRDAQRTFLRQEKAKGARLTVLEIPLLFEAGTDKFTDLTIVVSANAAVQRARVLARPGMTETKLHELLRRQMPDDAKRARADFVVDTNGSVPACNAQIDAILANISAHPARAFNRFWM